MAGEAQLPGREMSEAEFKHIRHRYAVAGRLVKGKSVLDVGCGAGLGLSYLAARASRVVGTDLFADNIALASAQQSDKIDTLVMDAHKLDFADNSFDVVLAMEVAQYLRMEEFLAEARRVLVPGGTLFVCIPNPQRPEFSPGRGTIRYYSVSELTSLLDNAGFDPTVNGAFDVPNTAQKAAVGARDGIIKSGIRMLDIFAPILPTRRIKDSIRKLIGYKPVRLKAILDEADIAEVANIPVDDLSSDSDDTLHVFLYASARSRKCP